MRIAFLFLALAAAADAAAADRPHVVWLVAEDCSKHFFDLFDEHGAATPRIAALAEHGLTFDHAFSCAPVCSVARTTLMTSCYAPRIGAQFHRRAKLARLPGDLRMFPAYLREAGYYTTNRQKKDYNVVESPDAWDESSARATWRGGRPDQPFFHMQSFPISHEGRLHFEPTDVDEAPTATDPATVFVPPIHPDTELFRYTYARYHDQIALLDRQIGQVLDELEADGLLEETFVFFFGDHGGVLPGSKGFLQETGLHVPLVVRVPERWRDRIDAPLGERRRGFVSFVDLGPTVLHLAGVAPPKEIDGRPFLGPDVDRDEVESRNVAFGYADRFDEKIDLVRSLRQGRYKYVRSFQPFNFDGLQNNYRYRMAAYRQWRAMFHQGRLDEVQARFFQPRPVEALYDVAADPYETRDLSGDPAHQDKLVDLRRALTARLKATPDLSFFPESVLVEQALDDPVGFGSAQRERIGRLIDVADAQLAPWDEARRTVAAALSAADPWERLWGLITCSARYAEAGEFLAAARILAANDGEPLVRVRAAEFLALVGANDPAPVLLGALSDARSGVEATLILNSLVLLRDGATQNEFPGVADALPAAVREHDGVQRRLEYLQGR